MGRGFYGARIYGAIYCPIDLGWDLWGCVGPTDLWGQDLWGRLGPHRFGLGFMGLYGTPQIYGAGILWGQGLWGLFDPIDLWGWDLWGFVGPTDLWGQDLWDHLLPHRFGLGFMGPFGTP